MGTGHDIGSLVRQTADRLAARHIGVVVAALAGDAVEIYGAGRTGRGVAQPPDAATLFEVGSLTKVFTALLLASRAGGGAVALDQPLRALLPAGAAVPSRDGREILLRHLASHTSGLPRLPRGLLRRSLGDFPEIARDPYRHCTAQMLLDGLAGTRLRGAPGARFRYSNLGAGLLGLALATQAGSCYGDLLAAEILRPLGMTQSTADAPAGELADRLAQGHTGRGRPAPPWQMAALAGAGGLRSSAADLVTFARAQLGGATGGLAAAIRTSHGLEHRVNERLDVRLGWFGQELPPDPGGDRYLWHNGQTGGFASYLAVVPERGVAVVVLSNAARSVDGPATELLRAVLDTAPPGP